MRSCRFEATVCIPSAGLSRIRFDGYFSAAGEMLRPEQACIVAGNEGAGGVRDDYAWMEVMRSWMADLAWEAGMGDVA